MIEEIITNTLHSFDFAFCITINILTYIVIKAANEQHKCNTTWSKRIVLLCSILLVGTIYLILGTDGKLLINSAILAPVFWSWVMKPVCKHYNIDYGSNKIN